MSYAFTFDASACSGCKACQEACKDKNRLPVGILWRRVIEVSGGEWHTAGTAWENSVFAYNLSMACNHCTHPKCAGVCPTDAYIVRPDGIVRIDASKCIGCGYCAWACPYGVPQYDDEHGIMTKCDFCYDSLDAGEPPSCVAACPLRVLDYGTIESLGSSRQGLNLWQLPASEHPFPLPVTSRTEPHLVIKPHAGMENQLGKAVANREEILPPHCFENNRGKADTHELPLVAFSLLLQTAGGLAVCNLVFPPVHRQVWLAIGILWSVGGIISFLHLGRKRNAWRAFIHLKKSWLSREILMTGLFGATWALTAASQRFGNASPSLWPMAIFGLGLIYSMARVYLLRAVPPWNSWRTPAAFFLSAIVLGTLGINLAAPNPGWIITAGFAMVVELCLILTGQSSTIVSAGRLRIVLLGLGIIEILLSAIYPPLTGLWQAISLFLIALAAEGIGRWQFYAARTPFLMHAN
jgi:anaerobic dimethyl sulfoxide reductase subunit B (iron-sulfur subunit)